LLVRIAFSQLPIKLLLRNLKMETFRPEISSEHFEYPIQSRIRQSLIVQPNLHHGKMSPPMADTSRGMDARIQKKAQKKLVKVLLEMIILKYLTKESIYGYQLIGSIRKEYDVSLGASVIYPLLNLLEKEGYVKSVWNMAPERPRKVFAITEQGKNRLKKTEISLLMIYQRITK
jgi:PadR family transcriptional regulator, regulatory protein PadR